MATHTLTRVLVLFVGLASALSAQSPVSRPDAPASDFSMKVTAFDTTAFPLISMKVKFLSGPRIIRNTTGITAEVYENGVPQTARMSCSNLPFAAVLVLDKSLSMAFFPNTRIVDPDSNRWRNAKNALHTFVDQLTPIDQCALVSFSRYPVTDQALTSDKVLLHDALEGVVLSPSTAIWLALQQAINILKPRTESKAIILLTDGEDNASGSVTEKTIIRAARASGIKIFTVGLGEEVGRQILSEVADSTGGSFYFSASGSDLTNIYYDISQQLADGCTVTYTTSAHCADGTRRAVQLFGSQQNDARVLRFDTAYTAPDRLEHAVMRAPLFAHAKPGEDIRIPVVVSPGFRPNEPVHFEAVLDYPGDLVDFRIAEVPYHLLDSSTRATFDPATRTLRLEARTGSSDDSLLFILSFTTKSTSSSRMARLSIRNISFRQDCPYLTSADDVVLLIEGECEKILTRGPAMLKQNYPNPFSGITMLQFVVPGGAVDAGTTVDITILNQAGEAVEIPVSGMYAPGSHRIPWDASNLPSGVYTIELRANNRHEVRHAVHLE